MSLENSIFLYFRRGVLPMCQRSCLASTAFILKSTYRYVRASKPVLCTGVRLECASATVVSIRGPEFECSGPQLEGPEFECSGPQLEGPEFEYSELSLKENYKKGTYGIDIFSFKVVNYWSFTDTLRSTTGIFVSCRLKKSSSLLSKNLKVFDLTWNDSNAKITQNHRANIVYNRSAPNELIHFRARFYQIPDYNSTGQLYTSSIDYEILAVTNTRFTLEQHYDNACSTERNIFGTIESSDANFWKTVGGLKHLTSLMEKLIMSVLKISFHIEHWMQTSLQGCFRSLITNFNDIINSAAGVIPDARDVIQIRNKDRKQPCTQQEVLADNIDNYIYYKMQEMNPGI
ncbi:hypothetical protein ANN_14306 [Periplaneta americana]|uniref:Uncharacterized protein n=1 Tax=Periplaneta americana TaxID=6978 RepID=A0ABQ8SX12_PERAM|nr:hypothetical protein ANN_14306 [Periplaneta americana]